MPSPIRAAILATGLALTAGCSVFGGKAAEEPAYAVVRAEAPFEIRDYPPIAVAQTVVQAENRRAATREGFGRLFDYISGANAGSTEIDMTAPVIQSESAPAGEMIAMTAPVLQSGDADGLVTAFVLPDGMTATTAPQPTDPQVSLATLPGRRAAVIRFSGSFGAEGIAENRDRLAAWLDTEGIAHKGDWQAAGYNPPWTVPALRRNEVLVTLE